MKFTALLVIFTFGIGLIQAKTFGSVEYCKIRAIIEKEDWMMKAGNITDWMCLVEKESSYRTNITGKKNEDGSWDYGAFQVSEKWFCRGKHWGNFHFLKKIEILKYFEYILKMFFLSLGNPDYNFPDADLCNMNCSQFLDTDLRDDIQCVKFIYHEKWMNKKTTKLPNGFHPWDGWKNSCMGKDLSDFDRYCPKQKGEL